MHTGKRQSQFDVGNTIAAGRSNTIVAARWKVRCIVMWVKQQETRHGQSRVVRSSGSQAG